MPNYLSWFQCCECYVFVGYNKVVDLHQTLKSQKSIPWSGDPTKLLW